MVIAFKYATYDPVKIEIIRNHPLTFEEIAADFYLVDWFNQSDRVSKIAKESEGKEY